MATQPRQASLLGLPAELRQMILHELLHCTETLADIPNIALVPINRPTLKNYHAAHFDDARPHFHAATVAFDHEMRFHLDPQILGVCRQLYNDGLPLLYKDKTIEVTYLHAFSDPSFHDPHEYLVHEDILEKASPRYCLGEKSVREALQRWPMLRNIRNWEYNVYLGPGLKDNPAEEDMVCKDDDFEVLEDFSLENLTMRYTLAAEGRSSRFYSQAQRLIMGPGAYDNALIAFTLPQWKNIQLVGDLPSYINHLISDYDLNKLQQSTEDWEDSIIDFVNIFTKEIEGCNQCRKGREYWQGFKEHHCEGWVMYGLPQNVDHLHGRSRDVLCCSYMKLHETVNGCFYCGTVRPELDYGKLRMLLGQVKDLEARGPWKQPIYGRKIVYWSKQKKQ